MTEDKVTYRYRVGGLMRCCTLTLALAYDVGEPAVGEVPAREGALLPCRRCSSAMVFRDGAWEWDKSRKTRPHVPPAAPLAA